jgi:acetyl-CoA C-acetyltransferase
MSSPEVVICNPVRTAIGTYNGSLKAVSATDLGGAVIAEVLRRARIRRQGRHRRAGQRHSGWQPHEPRPAGRHRRRSASLGAALTVNRVCGSGAQAIASAAQEVLLGFADVAIAGGMENMDQAPYLLPNGRWGSRMGDTLIYDSMLRDGLNDAFSGQHSGWHTEDLVAKMGLSRLDTGRVGSSIAAALCQGASSRALQ